MFLFYNNHFPGGKKKKTGKTVIKRNRKAKKVMNRKHYLQRKKRKIAVEYLKIVFKNNFFCLDAPSTSLSSAEIWEAPVQQEIEKTVDEDIDDFLDDLFQ